jgi:Dolichyl-phosphate-mannose-protein mannosyltransferase
VLSRPGGSGGSLLVLELALLAGLLLVALFPRLARIEHYSGSFDEGVRAQQLFLMELGFRPFRDIFASQGPLLLDLLYPFYVGFGRTLGAIRLGVSTLSLLGLVGAWWAGRALHPLAGLGAAALLAVSPLYLENSRLALAEIPSLAPCVWAVGAALRYHRGGTAGWLYAAVLLGALGLLIKPMALPVLVPIALLALCRRPLGLRTPLLAVLTAATFMALVFVVLGPLRVFEVLGSYRGSAQQSPGSQALANWALIVKTLLGTERAGFVALGVVGGLLGLFHQRAAGWALLTWLLAQLGLFLLYTDLADKHLVYLVPLLALVAGLALSGLASLVRQFRAGRAPLVGVGALAASLALALYLSTIPALGRADEALLKDVNERARRDFVGTQEQAELMAELTGPNEFVLTDHPLAAFLARRPTPPWLVDTSGTRIDAGSLTSAVAIRDVERYRPRIVVTLRRRLGKLEAFQSWLTANYRLLKTYPGSDPTTPLQLYVSPDLEPAARAFLTKR